MSGTNATSNVYWISCAKFTVRVACDERDMIIEAAPIVRRFVGQPLANLLRWAAKFSGVRIEPLS